MCHTADGNLSEDAATRDDALRVVGAIDAPRSVSHAWLGWPSGSRVRERARIVALADHALDERGRQRKADGAHAHDECGDLLDAAAATTDDEDERFAPGMGATLWRGTGGGWLTLCLALRYLVAVERCSDTSAGMRLPTF